MTAKHDYRTRADVLRTLQEAGSAGILVTDLASQVYTGRRGYVGYWGRKSVIVHIYLLRKEYGKRSIITRCVLGDDHLGRCTNARYVWAGSD